MTKSTEDQLGDNTPQSRSTSVKAWLDGVLPSWSCFFIRAWARYHAASHLSCECQIWGECHPPHYRRSTHPTASSRHTHTNSAKHDAVRTGSSSGCASFVLADPLPSDHRSDCIACVFAEAFELFLSSMSPYIADPWAPTGLSWGCSERSRAFPGASIAAPSCAWLPVCSHRRLVDEYVRVWMGERFL